MKERVTITGSEGNIGTILKEGLSKDYDLTLIDILTGTDVRNYKQLLKAVQEQDILIHLAWNSTTENFKNVQIDPDNFKMAKNAYEAALRAGVKRIIMASSVHAHKFYDWKFPPLISINIPSEPDSPYGEDKIAIENLGRDYALKGLEVVVIRLGGINPTDIPPLSGNDPWEERAAWLSRNDCISLIKSVIQAENIPGNFVLMYAVSNNRNRIHDTSNPFGWRPIERAEDFQK
ncbi:MAG: hypothetical protein A2W22_04710 [Candidatus Levybacteria bacterium RBG_16_35_11]|nr:MAG: hypothetical protein A2W22_04710 [Candidatus Levybacteria bacterium RBG_16_35_11]